MYQVYGMPRTRSTRVVWALEELEAEYEFHLVDLMKREGQSPEFLKLNPFGKIPVLIDGDLVLTESAAICTYLGDKYPQSGLVPVSGTRERAIYDQWSYFVMTELEQPLWTIAKHRFSLPEEKRVPAILDVALWEFQRAAAVLADYLEGREYLVGAAFTMVDILAAHSLLWARAYKLPHNCERLDRYTQQISERAAFSRAREREAAGK